MNVHIIRTDGREERIDAPFDQIETLIGAECLDTVNLRDGRVMCVDDNGYEYDVVNHGNGRYEHRVRKARKAVNEKATALYHSVCVPGTQHQIVGDVAIVVDSEVA